MSDYLIDVTEYVHTCPGDPQPHPVVTSRTVVEQVPGGPCHQPRTVRSGTATVTVDCARLVPAEYQCAACRNTVTVRTITRIDLGAETVTPGPPSSGVAALPCTVCGEPLADVLASSGMHLLPCGPDRYRHR